MHHLVSLRPLRVRSCRQQTFRLTLSPAPLGTQCLRIEHCHAWRWTGQAGLAVSRGSFGGAGLNRSPALRGASQSGECAMCSPFDRCSVRFARTWSEGVVNRVDDPSALGTGLPYRVPLQRTPVLAEMGEPDRQDTGSMYWYQHDSIPRTIGRLYSEPRCAVAPKLPLCLWSQRLLATAAAGARSPSSTGFATWLGAVCARTIGPYAGLRWLCCCCADRCSEAGKAFGACCND